MGYIQNITLLRTIYYSICETRLQYGCQLWGQAQTQVLQNIEIWISNLKFVYDQRNKILLIVFEKFFINKTRQHLYNTRGNSLDVPQVKTATYGSNSFTLHAICTWDFFQNKLSTTASLPNLTLTKFLKVIKTCIFKKAQIPKISKLRTSSFH